MKALSFLFLFLFSTLSAQISPKRAVGVSLLPDYGAGVIYTQYFGHIAPYASYSHTIMHFSTRYDIANKVAIGASYVFFKRTTYLPGYLTAGMSYNWYETGVNYITQSRYTTMPCDLQLGFGIVLKSVNVGFRYDCFKKDASVDVSWNFGRNIMKFKPIHKRI